MRSNRIVKAAVVITATIILLWLAFTQIRASNAPPTVKIGLIAPFEGHYRSTGYEALFAVKVALQERNREQGLNGYRVELVALNDFNDGDEAYRQARALSADPDIIGIIGHFSTEASRAALPVYREMQLAVVIPWSVDAEIFGPDAAGVVSIAATQDEISTRLEAVGREMGFERLDYLTADTSNSILMKKEAFGLRTDAVTAGNLILNLQAANVSPQLFGQADVGNRQLIQVAGATAVGLIYASPGPAASDVQADAAFVEAYQAMSGLPPDPRAVLAYDAAHVLLDSIEQAIITHYSTIGETWYNSRPDRADVSAVIKTIQRPGVSGQIRFNPQGRRVNAPVWIYQISEMGYPGKLIAP